MSRLDKQQHQDHVVGTARDTSVRLFAFSNARPRYQVVFSPEEPLIILKSKKSAKPQHPCEAWEPLSTLIYSAQPNTTHAVYVADTTEMSSVTTYEQEEHVNGAAVGPLLKRLGNTLIRLNPHNATMVAAGTSAHLGLKYMLVGEKTLGHRDRLVQRIILYCPSSLRELVALTNAAARRPLAEGYPLPEVVVMLSNAAEVPKWRAWLLEVQDTHKRIDSFRIVTDCAPSAFAAIAREAGLDRPDGTTVDVLQRHLSPRVYRIDFVLSKQTKTVIQLPRLSPLTTLGYDEDEEDDGEDGHHHHHSHHGEEEDEGAETEEGVEEDDESNSESAEEEAAAAAATASATADAAHGHSHGHHHHSHHHHDRAHGGGCETGCCGDHDHDHDEDEEAGGSMLVSGLQALAHWCDPVRVIVEGRVLDLAAGLIGTTDGCVVVSNLQELANADATLTSFLSRAAAAAATTTKASKTQRPPAVAVAATLYRDDAGRTTLLAEEVRPLTKAEVKQSMTCGSSLEEIPVQYNTSRIAHSYGALLLRGRKCALVRDVEAAHVDSHMTIPCSPHDSADESAMACAVRALCDGCEVSSDNFYLPSYLPPVVYYTKDDDGTPRCVTVYTALAISPPPRGPASDAVEDTPEVSEPYDWVSFDRALSLLATEGEQTALREARQHLEKARTAGLYTPFKGCGVFGEAVKPLSGVAAAVAPAASSSRPAAAAAAAAVRATSLRGIELYVVVCPGDTAQELVPVLRRALHTTSVLVCDGETTTSAIAAVAQEAKQNGDSHVLLYLSDDEDAEAFCEAHLLDLTEEQHATAQVFTVLLPTTAQAILNVSGTAAAAAEAEARLDVLLSASRVSDALVTLVPPERLSAEERALLRVCCRANADLSLFFSWEARRAFTLEDVAARTAANAEGPALREWTVRLPAGLPAAPAALAYLTHAGALDCFFAEGRCRLLFAQGGVWIPTRGSTQGFVFLDVVSHCLAVEPGAEWEGTNDAARTSELTLLVWCASGAVAEETAAQVSAITSQLQWDVERDGEDWRAAHDPLPKWE